MEVRNEVKFCLICCYSFKDPTKRGRGRPSAIRNMFDEDSVARNFSKFCEELDNLYSSLKGNGGDAEVVGKYSSKLNLNTFKSVSVCMDCFASIRTWLERREKAKEVEAVVNFLQMQLQNELKKLEGHMKAFCEELRKIEDVVKNSDDGCLLIKMEEVGMGEEEGRKDVEWVREMILKVGSNFRFFKTNHTAHTDTAAAGVKRPDKQGKKRKGNRKSEEVKIPRSSSCRRTPLQQNSPQLEPKTLIKTEVVEDVGGGGDLDLGLGLGVDDHHVVTDDCFSEPEPMMETESAEGEENLETSMDVDQGGVEAESSRPVQGDQNSDNEFDLEELEDDRESTGGGGDDEEFTCDIEESEGEDSSSGTEESDFFDDPLGAQPKPDSPTRPKKKRKHRRGSDEPPPTRPGGYLGSGNVKKSELTGFLQKAKIKLKEMSRVRRNFVIGCARNKILMLKGEEKRLSQGLSIDWENDLEDDFWFRKKYKVEYSNEKGFTVGGVEIILNEEEWRLQCSQCEYGVPLPKSGRYEGDGREKMRLVVIHIYAKHLGLYKCRLCGKRNFPSEKVYRDHVRIHRVGRQTVSCEICGKKLMREDSLPYHRQSHMSEEEKEEAKKNGTWKEKRATSGPTGLHKCPVCEKIFTRKGALRTHMETHNERERIQCEDCGRVMLLQSYNIYHKVVGCPAKPNLNRVACPKCDQTFKKRDSLANHMARRHGNGDRPHICDVCGKTFKCRDGMLIHRQLHNDKLEFKCRSCGKEFAIRRYYLRHEKKCVANAVAKGLNGTGTEEDNVAKLEIII